MAGKLQIEHKTKYSFQGMTSYKRRTSHYTFLKVVKLYIEHKSEYFFKSMTRYK